MTYPLQGSTEVNFNISPFSETNENSNISSSTLPSASTSNEENIMINKFWKTPLPTKLSPPVVFDHNKWRAFFLRELQKYILSQDIIDSTPQKLLGDFIEARAIQSIPLMANLQFALLENQNNTLIHLFLLQSPKGFLASFKKLKKDARHSLYKVVGGKAAIKFLKDFFNKENQDVLLNHVKMFLSQRKTHEIVQNKQQVFPEGFDQAIPISSISCKTIVDSFHFLYARFLFDNSYFTLNEEQVTIPIQRSPYLWDRKIGILSHMIGELQKHLTLHTSPKFEPANQADYLCRKGGNLTNCNPDRDQAVLINLFKNEQCNLALFSSSTLNKYSLSTKFAKWLEMKGIKYVVSYIQGKEPEEAAKNLVQRYYIGKNLQTEIEQTVPCFRILQALSCGALSIGSDLFKSQFAPFSFHTANDIPYLQASPSDTIKYKISIEPDGESFQVTHIKPFLFVVNKAEVIGGLNVNWTLSGSLSSDNFKADLHCDKVTFFPDSDPNNCLGAMTLLNLDIRKGKK